MKLGLWTTFVLVSLLLRATTVHGQQPPNKPDDTAREVLEIKQFLLQVVARLEKIEGQISGPEGQTQARARRRGGVTDTTQLQAKRRLRSQCPDGHRCGRGGLESNLWREQD